MAKDWVIKSPAANRETLAVALGVSPITAQVLINRGICDPEPARQFLKPQMRDLLPPEMLPGATAAAGRIARAVRDGEPIVIFGDYDVDGITGASILWHCLRLAGATPSIYIPHRLEEGYGINSDAIDKLANQGARLVITVDCGITAIEQTEQARRRGMEVIITDHHSPHVDASGQPILPETILVHPTVGSGRDTRTMPVPQGPYPNPHLSGAGVALKLAWAIGQAISGSQRVSDAYREFLVEAIGLAALGTIADVVPLLGENRLIAHFGLAGLPKSRLPGIRALIESASLNGKRIDGYDIGFKLAPRLNAIGRMGHAQLAVDMLTRADADEAAKIARNLAQQNSARQALERKITAEAIHLVREQNQHADGIHAIVLASPGWHAGVIGIVASRVMEEFGRPTVMIALEEGVGQGSARSIRRFPLHEALADCREHLITFGGHAMAAGLRLRADAVDSFREALQRRAAQLLTPADLRQKLTIDDVVSLDALREPLVNELAMLEPFGAQNPSARLATEWLTLAGEPRAVGNGGSHLQLSLSDGVRQCKGIAFGQAKLLGPLRDYRRCRVAFEPILNEWNGRRTVEMQIADFQFPTS